MWREKLCSKRVGVHGKSTAHKPYAIYLDVAQFGRAPALGAGGCRFKSCHPD